MVICLDFNNGNCSSGMLCKNEHISIRKTIKNDAFVALKGSQWLLSCFGPFREKPSLKNFICDQSFEEIRYFYWLSTKQHNFPAYAQHLAIQIANAKIKMENLLDIKQDIFHEIVYLYNAGIATDSKQQLSPSSKSSDASRNNSTLDFEGTPPKYGSTPLFKNNSKSTLGSVSAATVKNASSESNSKPQVRKPPTQTNPFLLPQNVTGRASNPFMSNCSSESSVKRHVGNPIAPITAKVQSNSTLAFGTAVSKNGNNEGTSMQLLLSRDADMVESSNNFKKIKNSNNGKSMCDENQVFQILVKTLVEVTEKLSIIQKKVDDIHLSSEKVDDQLKTHQNEPLNQFNRGILVRPKSYQSSKNTMDHIKSEINLNRLRTPITFRKSLKNGGVILKTDTANNNAKLKATIAKNLGEFYTVEEITRGNPGLIIYGLERQYKSDELIDEIKNLNSSIPEDVSLRIVTTRLKKNSNKWIALIEVSTNLYDRLVNSEIHIGFNKHRIHKNYNVMRCFKCQKYGHLAKFCMNDHHVCTKCAGYHRTLDCFENTIKCANCALKQPEKQCQHTADNVDCPVFQKAARIARKKMNCFF